MRVWSEDVLSLVSLVTAGDPSYLIEAVLATNPIETSVVTLRKVMC